MKTISFYTFKQNCSHLYEASYVDLSCCQHGGNEDHKFKKLSDIEEPKRFKYRACCEKSCPVMSGLRDAK